jgi:hypothetical protein
VEALFGFAANFIEACLCRFFKGLSFPQLKHFLIFQDVQISAIHYLG